MKQNVTTLFVFSFICRHHHCRYLSKVWSGNLWNRKSLTKECIRRSKWYIKQALKFHKNLWLVVQYVKGKFFVSVITINGDCFYFTLIKFQIWQIWGRLKTQYKTLKISHLLTLEQTTTLGATVPTLCDKCVGSSMSPTNQYWEDAAHRAYSLSFLSEKTRMS